MSGLLSLSVPGGTVAQWIMAAVIATLVALALAGASRMARTRMTAWAATTSGHLDDAVADVLHATRRWFVLGLALMAGAQALTLPERATGILDRGLALALVLQGGFWVSAGLRGWLRSYIERRRGDDATAATTAAILGFVARVVLWSLVLMVALDNLGVDVTALIASLGIGGIAVALAAQSILGDLFASLAIALDKPVVIGDFIVLGDVMGTVERVGLKTLHLRSLSGELVVLPNSDLLSSRIRNYKHMSERRVLFGFGVTYQTPPDRLRAIPQMVRGIIERDERARFERAHLASFGASALLFEVVYFVNGPDYNVYMDVQQRINFALIDALGEAGVEFAYPTQTIYLAPSTGVGA